MALQFTLCARWSVVVMLGEIVLAGARPSASKIMSVVVLTVGIGVFMLFKPSKKAGSGDTFEWNMDMAKGCFLVLLALVMDGVYGPYQNKITKEAEKATGEKLSTYHLMFNMNFYQGVFSLIMVSLESPALVTFSIFSFECMAPVTSDAESGLSDAARSISRDR